MKKINSREELLALYEQYQSLLDLRKEEKDVSEKYHISVCGGTGCTSSNSLEIVEELKKYAEIYHVADKVEISITGCFGFCERGPIVKIFPDHTFYVKVTPQDAEKIIKQHIVEGKVVEELLYKNEKGEKISKQDNINFYKKQHRIALRNCGLINPEVLEETIAVKGYQALAKVLYEMAPDDVIKEVSDSGLRGRGGAGFLTGQKWRFAKAAVSDKKYIICNADEGDPGAFMDRSILEGDPHSVLESMAIAGYAIGADEGEIYIRAEYPLAVHRLEIAIREATEAGLLGDHILGTNFSFHINIKYGAGAFVCGEETALIHSIEGKRGEPTLKPPFPATKGLFGKPTNVNNVETWANVAPILLNGSKWFASIGTEKSKGTKVFAVGGKIHNVGLVEVPMGTTLRTIVYDIGGGIPGNKAFKAAQTGGPSGGCIPAKYIDTPMDFDSLKAIGSMMGSGGLIVMDEDTCMVDIAKFYLEFTADESCGKCNPCRIGTKRLLEILTRITEGKGRPEDIRRIRDLAEYMQASSLCALGQSAPNPILSTMNHFLDEYEAHINEKRCPAGVCKSLLNYYILTDKCRGCTLCARNCPVQAISGSVKSPHIIDTAKCIKCGQCIAHCKFGAIIKK